MRRAFTLIELLLVMAIMGLLGTFAVTGFRQMYRGMEERGVVQNVDQFLRTAFQRAQIDRHPVVVYFWNETYRADEENQTLIVVGRAVAVRYVGRVSAIVDKSAGRVLVDEFNDLKNMRYKPPDADEMSEEELLEVFENPPPAAKGDGTFLYRMDGDGISRSLVAPYTIRCSLMEPIVNSGDPDEYEGIEAYGYLVTQSAENNASWKVGDAYGQEFSFLTLPQNMIFGSGRMYSEDAAKPVRQVQTIKYMPYKIAGNGSTGRLTEGGVITVSSLRPNAEGVLEPVSIGQAPADEGSVR